MKVGDSGVKIVRWLRARMARRRTEDQFVRHAKELLGIDDRQTYAYRAAGLHPLFARGVPHPDDATALATVAGSAYATANRRDAVDEVEALGLSLNDGMVLIGSPEAEGIARLAFGYRRRADGLGMEDIGAPIELPFRWQEDRTRVEATYRRFVANRGLVERPNWPVVDQRGAPRRLFPRVGNDGLLQSDFLVVTKVPNFLTRIGYESGRSIITFAGSHGTGTRAVEVLMRDRSTLRQVGEHLPADVQAFQLLFEASNILHDSANGSKARAVRLLACCPLDRPDAMWDGARRVVEQRLGDWYTEMESEQ